MVVPICSRLALSTLLVASFFCAATEAKAVTSVLETTDGEITDDEITLRIKLWGPPEPKQQATIRRLLDEDSISLRNRVKEIRVVRTVQAKDSEQTPSRLLYFVECTLDENVFQKVSPHYLAARKYKADVETVLLIGPKQKKVRLHVPISQKSCVVRTVLDSDQFEQFSRSMPDKDKARQKFLESEATWVQSNSTSERILRLIESSANGTELSRQICEIAGPPLSIRQGSAYGTDHYYFDGGRVTVQLWGDVILSVRLIPLGGEAKVKEFRKLKDFLR